MSTKPLFASLLLLFFTTVILAEPIQISGQAIDRKSGSGIPGVEIFTNQTGAITDLSGNFVLLIDDTNSVTVRCIGYETLELSAHEASNNILLQPTILEGQSINVTSTRVIPGVSPVAYSILESEEIGLRYSVEDVPMILSSEAGVHAYSESGNGTGYSYVSIRGFDQSRISVMLDNVPLNDNESHQVYWVDHGDILSGADDVEIQRGVGSSLYGATAFGGSININTRIKSETEQVKLTALRGSYNTSKYRLAYDSGTRFGENLNFSLRGSLLNSDGYRVDSRSEQQSLTFGVEHRGNGLTNQFRAVIGKELSVLQWDGVSQEYLNDEELRRSKMSWTVPFTDDYLQQIYSLNTTYNFNPHSMLRNVVYLVKGTGFYEVEKYGRDYYSYNLDVADAYDDTTELNLEVDFLRKKWINNIYYGITPVWTYESTNWRSDLGIELRNYVGDHFGEVSNVSDPELAATLPDVYEYYSYKGQKQLVTAFGHFLYRITPQMTTSLDLRAQGIWWQLDQETIGHAPGVDLSADWKFVNPRIGLRYAFSPGLSVFAGIGTAQKEPADAQIIEADDVWSTPTLAPAEGVTNKEIGANWFSGQHQFALNLYQIDYENELLSDIYDFQDGSFDVETANLTRHQGIEIDARTTLSEHLHISVNGTFSENKFQEGTFSGKSLINVPGVLANGMIRYELGPSFQTALSAKYVGKQYIDFMNTEDLAIPEYLLTDVSLFYSIFNIDTHLKINNVFDTRYATYGYEYWGGYYWPGATRNYTLSLNYSF